MKKEKTPFNFFYSGYSLVEYPNFNEIKPPGDNTVSKGDDGHFFHKNFTIYPSYLIEFADGTGKA